MFEYLLVTYLVISGISGQAFVPEKDVKFLLLTRANTQTYQQLLFGDIGSITRSNFKSNLPTRFSIHGYSENCRTTNSGFTLGRTLLSKTDLNFIFIDWCLGSNGTYLEAKSNVRGVANVTAKFIDFLNLNQRINFQKLSINGFSLGAHIAGITGKLVTRGRVSSIIGLDPAGPLFSVSDKANRIDAGDAEYVECIHTNGLGNILLNAGIGSPICLANFYPNGATQQPGCNGTVIEKTECSHGRSVEYYIESVGSNNKFWANQCSSTKSMSKTTCQIKPGAYMGGEPSNYGKNVKGIYYLVTNSNSPFGQGIW